MLAYQRSAQLDTVTIQEERNIVVIYNHPSNTGASLADLSLVAWLKAEILLVVNPDGTLHRYAREGDETVALEPIHNPEYVAPADPFETAAASIAYWIQTLREIGNPPEMVMLQAPNMDEFAVNTNTRLAQELFLKPATAASIAISKQLC